VTDVKGIAVDRASQSRCPGSARPRRPVLVARGRATIARPAPVESSGGGPVRRRRNRR
jgi:hypothetical protein